MRLFEVLSEATHRLEQAGTSNPLLDAELLLSFRLGVDRTYLLAHYHDELNDSLIQVYFTQVNERGAGKPIQYILGRQEFRNLEFEVTRDVLIPRPETELVVEEVIRLFESQRVLLVDVGTGSGCIAVSLAVALAEAEIFATDVSRAALEVARRNALRHGVAKRVQFLEGDLLGPLSPLKLAGSVDCIVSNPPYVSEVELLGLQREVREWEPKTALLAGSDGLSVLKRLIPQADSFLRPGGLLVLEIGYSMRGQVYGLLGPEWQVIRVREDLSGIPRIFLTQKR